MKKYSIFFLLFLSFLFSACNDDPSTKTEEKTRLVSSDKSVQDEEYKGKKDEILNHLTVDKIPADFPVYRKGESKKEYKVRCIMWAKENLDLVKPEYREKVEKFQKK